MGIIRECGRREKGGSELTRLEMGMKKKRKKTEKRGERYEGEKTYGRKIERKEKERKGKRERKERERGPTMLGQLPARQRRSCGGIRDNEVGTQTTGLVSGLRASY